MNRIKYKTIQLVKIRMVKEASVKYKDRIDEPDKANSIFRPLFNGMDREQFVVLGLNADNTPTIINIASIGGIKSSQIDCANVFKPLILSNSVAFICAHNHPSGTVNASQEDINSTRKLKSAGELLGIHLLDHIIIGDKNHFLSLQEARMI